VEQLDFRLSDGLQEIVPGEADAFLCAGMGGKLIVHILEDSMDVIEKMQGAVLQPQSEIGLVRKYIYEMGWHIAKEDMVFEAEKDGLGKYYPMMYIEPGKESMPDELALLYGPKLLQEKHPILKQFLQFSLGHKKGLYERLQIEGASAQADARRTELLAEINKIQDLLYERF